MGKRKNITSTIGWQLTGKLFVQGISFISAPVFTRILSPADYGQTSAFSTWVSMLQLVVGLQTFGSLAQAKMKFGEDRFEQYASSILGISIWSYAVFFLAGIIFKTPLSHLLGFHEYLIPVLVTQAFSNFIFELFSAKLELQYKADRKTFISIIYAVSSVFLSYFLIIHMESDRYTGRILGTFFPSVIIAVIEAAVIFGRGRKLFDRQYWGYCLRLTIPIIFHGLGGIILGQSDRIMLKQIAGEEETGIYSLTYTLALIVSILTAAFNQAWTPFYYDYKKQGKISKIRQGEKVYCVVFTIITMGFILCSPEVFKVIAPSDYWSGMILIPLAAMACYADFLYSFPANHEFYNEKTKMIMWGTISAALINIGLNYLLIPHIKGVGAAAATLLSSIFMIIFHDYNARRKIKKFEFRMKFYFVGSAGCMLSAACFYVFMDMWIIRWGGAVLLGVLLLVYIYKNKNFIINF